MQILLLISLVFFIGAILSRNRKLTAGFTFVGTWMFLLAVFVGFTE